MRPELTEGQRLPLGNLPGTRYPDPRIEALDKRFRLKAGNAAIERIATGFRWTEGPVYFADGGYLLWSDIPNNRIMRWLEEDGHVSVFRSDSHFANGNTRDREGRLVTCEHDARRVTRTEHDGRITILMDGFEGKRLNAPNDLVVASDGAVWLTDPGYGIDGPYEGHAAEAELPCNVYRLDPASGQARVVADDFTRPNGLAFSPDERVMYVANTRHTAYIHRIEMDSAGAMVRRGIFADMSSDEKIGVPDGMKVDVEGRVWCTGPGGTWVFAPDGTRIGIIKTPEVPANLAFGGPDMKTVFLTAHTSVYTLRSKVPGLPGHPFKN
jgi:gluconolactonase